MAVSDDAIDEAEYALANCRPFGDPAYIWQRLCRHYLRRLEMLEDYSNYAQAVVSELTCASEDQRRSVLGDPAVRASIDGFLRHVAHGRERVHIDELEFSLSLAAANLTSHTAVPPLAEGAREVFTLQGLSWPWIWSEDRVESDPLGEFFRRTFRHYLPGLSLMTPDPRMREMLLMGRKLLYDLVPELARSALAHVHLIAVVDPKSKGFTSLTHPRISGTVVFSPLVLTTPWKAAEYLLHEAMHVKFTDLERTHSLLHEDYSEFSSPRIRPIWNRVQPEGASDWPINRALTVCHVYTCLALFHSVLITRSDSIDNGRYGLPRVDVKRKARQSFDRAHYMRQQLAIHKESLGPGGCLLVRWLDAVLRSLDPSPPPEGAYGHLFLDLYEREADRLAELLQDLNDKTPRYDQRWTQLILDVTRQEIGSFGAIAALLSGSDALDEARRRFDGLASTAEASEASFREGAKLFLAVRRFLLAELLTENRVFGSLDLGDSRVEVESIIRAMVENSSQSLSALFSVNP